MRTVPAYVLAFFLLAPPSLHAACVRHGEWNGILRANVEAEGFVDYEGVRAKKGGDLSKYLQRIARADLTKCSESEKLAFWINAYNAIVFKKVLERPEMAKVSDDFKLFTAPERVAGMHLSLNDIEHRILRSSEDHGGPIKGVSLERLDPRIHFALVCAAVDCPRLHNRAYEAKGLDEALDEAAVRFANSPKHLRIESDALVASAILKWYRKDFERFGGAPAYLAPLTDPALRADADAIDAKLKADFPEKVEFRYDWTLNSIRNKR